MKRENIELTDQIRQIRKSYRTLEMEHQDVAQQVIHAKVAMAELTTENQQLVTQLGQMKSDMLNIQACMNKQEEFAALAKHNAHLVQVNSELEEKLTVLETVLIEIKVKYAESENEYEQMRQKLIEAQKLSLV